MKQRLILLLCCYAVLVFANGAEHAEEAPKHFQIVRFSWSSVEAPYTIALWILTAAIAKIAFSVFKPQLNMFPDSALLIVVGLVLGSILEKLGTDIDISLNSHTFFLYLLPPIIFDAGYFMPTRALFENIDSVLLFSVVGTVWNTISIGGTLLILSQWNLFTMSFTVFEIFVFSALISAVDPVAVIAVFEEINVNEFLFINVFGEALFNDGVTVVIYQMFKSFALIGAENLKTVDYFVGGFSFFVVALGGCALGIIFAFAAAFITKYTNVVKSIAPIFLFLFPYMSYLTAEMTSLSSIVAIAVCGMVMKPYVEGNVSPAAIQSVKYFTKMLAQSTEIVIFMFLGLSTIGSKHYFDFNFVLATVISCLLWRTVGVVVQCYVLNKIKRKKFTKVDQFILSYGGLRGAIAFGLAVSMPESIGAKAMFVTTTIIVIYFTVFLQGITIKPLVNYLHVEIKEDKKVSMAISVYSKYNDYIMSAIEDIAGQKGSFTFIENFDRFNAKFIRPLLLRNEKKQNVDASSIIKAYAKITLEEAMTLTKTTVAPKRPPTIVEEEDETDPQEKKKQTVYRPELRPPPILHKEENMDAIYHIFSSLLDRKLEEMQKTQVNFIAGNDSDIEDNYMKQMRGSHSCLQSTSQVRPLDEESRCKSAIFMSDRKPFH